MTDCSLAQAEEWARWAAVHDDWDKTQEAMGVLLAEYDRRGRTLAEAEHVIDAREDELFALRVETGAALAADQAVVDAAVAYIGRLQTGDWDYPGHETELLTTLAAAVRARGADPDTTTEKD